MKIAIIGAGWAGMAAAVHAVQSGHQVTVFEAGRSLGGRARGVPVTLPDGTSLMLDNGQHILIGAYTETLRLMRLVGVEPEHALLRLPLSLSFADHTGLVLPNWPTPLDALAGILGARGWRWRDKLALLRRATAWQRGGFQCAAGATVAELCAGLTQRLLGEFIEPLCVSALNTPAHQASGQVFLRVLQDALFSQRGGSNLLLPRVDLGALFPEAAARWVTQRGGQVHSGQRVQALRRHAQARQKGPSHQPTPQWTVDGEAFDRVILATAPGDAVRLLRDAAQHLPQEMAEPLHQWADTAAALRFEAITTVYAAVQSESNPSPSPSANVNRISQRAHPLLPRPMLALRATAQHPAQFVFDRGQLGGPAGLLAFVVSASQGERDALQTAVTRQARDQLSLSVQPLQTITEKRATFACTPALNRPSEFIAPGLSACGDHCQGPYPATLEGAVRSGWTVAGDSAY